MKIFPVLATMLMGLLVFIPSSFAKGLGPILPLGGAKAGSKHWLRLEHWSADPQVSADCGDFEKEEDIHKRLRVEYGKADQVDVDVLKGTWWAGECVDRENNIYPSLIALPSPASVLSGEGRTQLHAFTLRDNQRPDYFRKFDEEKEEKVKTYIQDLSPYTTLAENFAEKHSETKKLVISLSSQLIPKIPGTEVSELEGRFSTRYHLKYSDRYVLKQLVLPDVKKAQYMCAYFKKVYDEADE